MMVIYLPVKFEFDWSNRFKVRVRKRKMWTDRRTDRQTDVGHINLIGGLVTRNPPNYILFILLFYYIIFRICIVFQLFISSIPIYVVHIYAT